VADLVSMRKLLATTAVAAVSLALAACGSGGGNKAAATTTSTSQRTTPPPPPPPVTRKRKPRTATHLPAAAYKGHGPVLAWIRRLQHDLTTLHFYGGPITGTNSPATRTAIVQFQRAAHLKPDGLWGPKSQAALDKMLHRKPSKLPEPLDWIRNLQRDLTRLRFYSGPVDGIQTPATTAAIIRFQRAAHLKPDGLWGPKSQAALDRMLHRH
jgi:peptidoglycan hydrolase-like protein with peptidoglycan-binding domain